MWSQIIIDEDVFIHLYSTMRPCAYVGLFPLTRVLDKQVEQLESVSPTILHLCLLTRGFGNSNGVLSTALFVSPAVSGRPSRLRSCMVNLLILQPNDLNRELTLAGKVTQKDL